MAAPVSGQGPITVLEFSREEKFPSDVRVPDVLFGYIEEKPCLISNKDDNSYLAYMFHDQATSAKNLPEIIKSGRFAILKFKNGVPLGAILHPGVQLSADVNQFVIEFSLYNKILPLPSNLRIARSTKEQYDGISANALKYAQEKGCVEKPAQPKDESCVIS